MREIDSIGIGILQANCPSCAIPGADNPLGGSIVTSGIGDQNDYVKLSMVTRCVQGSVDCGYRSNAREQGSLALIGIGLFGLIRLRKARQG